MASDGQFACRPDRWRVQAHDVRDLQWDGNPEISFPEAQVNEFCSGDSASGPVRTEAEPS